MKDRHALERLFARMQADLADYTRLRDLLEEQFEAALHHRSEELAGIGERILELTAVLEERRRERVELVGRLLGREKAQAGVREVAARLPVAARGAFEACRAKLESLVRECKELNVRNCRLVMSQYEIMQRVLGGEPHTYAPR